jgi:peptidyl-prolyl cis-trans isomerase D
MLSFFRSLAKSKFIWILLGLPLVAGLLTIGNVRTDLSTLFTGKDAVIQSGSRIYTSADFKREFDAYRRQAQQQGQAVTPDEAVAQGLDQRMLGAFAERESMAEVLHKLGIWPSDKLVVAQIAKITAFFDPISGKFDQKTYVQRLQENNLTPEVFERNLRDEQAYNHFASAAAAGLKTPRIYGALVGAFSYEAHNLSLFSVDPRTLGPEPAATDADLTKLMKDNAAVLTVPETRALTVVKFSAAALAPTITADPAEVKKRFDFRKDTLSQPETRSLVQISVKDAAQAAAVADKLKSGADPAAVARGAGAQAPLAYNNAAKPTIADPKVGDAAFALPEGAVSGPIQGNLGWAVIKVLKVTPGKTVTFDEARPKIEEEVKTEAAANKAYDLVQKYQAAHEKGSTLAEAAKAAGVTPVTMAPVTASGQDADAKPTAALSQRMLKEAFALSQGGETDAIQDTKGEYFALRVDKVVPPTLPSLDTLRPRLTQFYLQREMSKRLDAKLNELAARVKKGESLDAVAKSVGATVAHLSVTRNEAQQSRTLQPQQVQQIFAANAGDVITTGAAVAKIDSITPPPAGIIASTMQGGQLSLARGIFDEIQQESRTWARGQVKPKTNLTLARQAIGANPAGAGGGQTGLVAPASPAGAPAR